MVCDFSPIAFHLFGFPIHWYSLAYIFGIIFVLLLADHLLDIEMRDERNTLKNFYKIPAKEDLEFFLNYAVIGIIIGGRLGHVLFYDFEYYFSYPIEILRIWKGGMSFFGGFIGCLISIAIFCWHKKINFWIFSDLLVVGTPIGLCLGRIANFINGELLGKEVGEDFAWAVIFRDGVLRHPSQLYEAFLEGILLFCLLLGCFCVGKLYRRNGILSAIFCIGYGFARFMGEFFREPDSVLGYRLLMNTGLNFNQYLSIGIAILGIIIICCKFRRVFSKDTSKNISVNS